MAIVSMNRDQLEKAFEQLDTQRAILTDCTVLWKDLSNHFTSLEQDISQKSKALDTNLQTLDSQTKETLDSLDQREQSLPAKEEAALALIDQKKESALAEIEKDKGNPTGGANDWPANLRSLCRKLDIGGLLRVLVSKRREVSVLRTEIPQALSESVDPSKLVLQAVEDFVFQRLVKSDGVSDQRWACGILLRALAENGGDLPESGRRAFAGSVVERARAVADTWKSKIDEVGELKDTNPADVQTFLQHLVTFGISSGFERDYLRNMVVAFSSRRDMPKLAVSLGFRDDMGDIIEGLVSNGKELDAVYFAYESGLTERFPPVPLLRAHLKNARKHANSMPKNGSTGMDATAFEMSILKAILRCVEDHKLESEFTNENLKKRISALEKVKAERKKTTAPSKSQNKRSRASGGGGAATAFPPAKAGRLANHYASSIRRNPGPTSYQAPYSYPVQGVREPAPAAATAPLGAYPSAHAGAPWNPATVSQHYSYMQPESSGPTYGAAANYGGGYDYGSGLPAPYQSSYTH